MDLFYLVMIALPLVFAAMFAMRMKRVFQFIKNPEQMGQLLSPPVRASLEAAGLDPERLDLVQLRKLEGNPELKKRVHDELQVAMRRVLSGKEDSATQSVPAMPTGSAESWNRPLPIDHASRQANPQWLALVAIAAAIGIAIALYQR